MAKRLRFDFQVCVLAAAFVSQGSREIARGGLSRDCKRRACGPGRDAARAGSFEGSRSARLTRAGFPGFVIAGDLRKTEAIPYTHHGGGRHSQLKQRNTPGSKGAWPQKATKVILDLLTNAEANADMRGLDVEELSLVHAQANRASPTRRRTYRAHGRIGPYMARPAHCEVVLAKVGDKVAKGEGAAKTLKLSSKRAAQLRIKEGGGL